MSRVMKRILAIVFAAVLTVSAFAPVTAQAADIPKSVTLYRSWKGTSECPANVTLSNLTGTERISGKSLKSSKKSVALVTSIQRNWNYGGSEAVSAGLENSFGGVSTDDCSYYICLLLKKPGTTKISYKMDGKKYTTKVKVLQYENPLKTVKIKGVESGKNVAGKFSEMNEAYLPLKKNVKNPTITLQTKKNWKITDVYLEGHKGYFGNIVNKYSYVDSEKATSKITLQANAFKKDTEYYLYIYLVNAKNGGTITCKCHIAK